MKKRTFILSLALCTFLFSCDRVNDTEKDLVINSKKLSANFLNDNLDIIKKLSKKSKKYSKSSLELKETNNHSISTADSDYVTLYNNAVNYLTNYGGMSQEEIKNTFKVDGDYRVIITAIALSQLEEENVETTAFGLQYKTQGSGVGNCVLEAAGVNALIRRGGAKLLARKVAAKFVPYVGWGLAAADFADCMGWFD